MRFHFDKSIPLSILFFCGCSTIMSILGDALAWHRMPKYDTIEEAQSHILNDYGHELIPYTCELTIIKRNMQTTVILFSLPFLVFRCYFITNGKQIFNNFTRLVGIMMLFRTITLISTSLPNPNPQCYNESITDISYHDAIIQTINSFPTKSCGNLMFSGHTMFLTLFCLFEFNYLNLNPICKIISFAKTILGIYYIIACRSHYTIDVVVSILLTNLAFSVYISKYRNFCKKDEKKSDYFIECEIMQGIA